MDERLYEKLIALSETDEYAFHMPGHKRNLENTAFDIVNKWDITEIEGFDNLHHPEGILKHEQEFASELYGSKYSFFLINGSTCGVLASICATTGDGEALVMARNSHKSAYNAVCLKGLQAFYVYPQICKQKRYIFGKITAEDVAEQMEKTHAKIVFLTSPTYEGIVSDIAEIAQEVHKRNGILIVDEAHGAHFGFHSEFPKSAISEGADIVIQSLHKTLPSLTQTALLHVCTDRVDVAKIKTHLTMFQTSSPSYVLMGSMSRCLHLLEDQGKEYFDSYNRKLQDFYKKTKRLKHLSVMTAEEVHELYDAQFDLSKINICVENVIDTDGVPYSGKELAKDFLEKYHLQMEMISEKHVIAMTSICDTQEGFDRLERALFAIDQKLVQSLDTDKASELAIVKTECRPYVEMSVKAALEAEREKIEWQNSIGKISAEYIYLYPPGSPIITPGEVLSSDIWQRVERYKNLGLNIQGTEDYKLDMLWVVKK